MWNPAKVRLFQDLETGISKWIRILVHCGQITFFRRLGFSIAEFTAKRRKLAIHIDHDANTAGNQQFRDITRTLGLLPEAMAITEGVNADDDMKGAFQLRCSARRDLAPCRK